MTSLFTLYSANALSPRTISDPEEAELEEAYQSARQCCSDLSEPYQPKIDFLATKKKQGKQSSSFCSSWFKDHHWLSCCVSQSKVFCFYCRAAASKGWLTFSTKAENTFTARGFNNWKKAKQSSGSMSRVWHIVKPC